MRFAILSNIYIYLLLPVIVGCVPSDLGENNGNTSKVPSESAESANVEKSSPFFIPSGNSSPVEFGWSEEAIQHYYAFLSIPSTDLETARVELVEVARLRFGEHALKDEWVEICFRIVKRGDATFLNIKRICELEIKLLTDTNAVAYNKGIEHFQGTLNQINATIEILKAQGQDPSQVKGELKLPTPE